MEVVEQAIGGRRNEPPAVYVLGQRAIRGVQYAHVVVEAGERVAGRPARVGIDGEASGKRPRPFVDPDDAQQRVAERPFGRRRAA